jgi:hypothetical protein
MYPLALKVFFIIYIFVSQGGGKSMHKQKVFGIVLSFVICFFSLLPAKAEGVLTPTIANAQFNQAVNVWTINGATADNTDVLLFLDNKFIGIAKTKRENSKNVFYFSSEKVLSVGEHYFTALVRDQQSFLTSGNSGKFVVKVESNREGKAITASTPTILTEPIIIFPEANTILGQDQPLIFGLANAGEIVEVYFDNQYDGETAELKGTAGATNFVYQSKNGLAVGTHTLFVKAKNSVGEISGQSASISFSVEQKVPAPILNEPIIKNEAGKLVLTGLAKSNLIINLYLDEKKVDSFRPINSNSETNNFAYTFAQDLTKGGHLIYATAVDEHDKVSDRSNYIYYVATAGSSTPSITPEAATEENNGEAKKETPAVSEEGSTKQTVDQNLNKILQPENQAEKNNSGLINESKEQQSKVKWNLLIFLLFLIALIAWMFWVNRELIKEKKAQVKKDEKAENNIQDKLI